jgi:signal peptidase I
MSTPVQRPGQIQDQVQGPIPVPSPARDVQHDAHRMRPIHLHLPTLPEAGASLLRTVIVALFLLTFLLQPFLIPSESMEHTLLVGDFLLVNKQIFANPDSPAGLSRWLLPYRDVQRGDIVVFHHARPPYLIKRVLGVPGDRIRIEDGRVSVNGVHLSEPYVAVEPAAANEFRDNFPSTVYSPNIDPEWWRQLQDLTRDGELVVPPGQYFMLGDNRNHSLDSRYWGFVPRHAIVARPLVIYFSLKRPSATDIQQASEDRLDRDRELTARLAGFARWKRIFHIVH